ncbi:hypothetical protein LXL04_029570 [Taraxacum kok-saghyz]
MTQTAREKDGSRRPVYARFAGAKWYKCCRQRAVSYAALSKDPQTACEDTQRVAGAEWDDTTPPAMCDRGKMVSRKQPPQQSSIIFEKTPPAMWDTGKIVNRKRPPPQSTISAAGIYV